MTLNNLTVLFLIIVILSIFIGVCTADNVKTFSSMNTSELVNASADNFDTLDNHQNNGAMASTISWNDKTTVSGKIRNFFKDFKFQSGFKF
jgi:hypothetical protein